MKKIKKIIPYKLIDQPISYQIGLELQKECIKKPNILLLLQHTPVYTGGRRIKSINHSIPDNAEYYNTSRGGQITFHGPGQLVLYPILDLKDLKTSVRCHVDQLENVLVHACDGFGVKAHKTQGTGYTGVWVGDKKIAAIGVHVARYITSHGFALNCNTDLNWFKHIIPCGLPDKGVTSLSNELQRNVHVKQAIPLVLESFQKVYNVECMSLADMDKEYDTLLNRFVGI